jgi:hypothetical protein
MDEGVRTIEELKELPGYKMVKRVHSTGALVSVVDGFAQDFDLAGGRWYNICETHDLLVSHDTLELARAFSSCPENWCSECQKLYKLGQKVPLKGKSHGSR